MLDAVMKKLITEHSAGMVATIDEQGLPAVSPKATFVIIDDSTLAFGHIRSPGTVGNLVARPAVQVCFLDPIRRKAVRVSGHGTAIEKANADQALLSEFEKNWSPYLHAVKAFVVIKLTRVEMILSPAYDLGLTEAELVVTNLAKLNALRNTEAPD